MPVREKLRTFGGALVDKEKMKTLLDTGSRRRNSDEKDLLLESVKKGPLSVQECTDLLDARADIDAQDGLGVSALMCTAFAGSADCVRVLLERGAAPEPTNCDGWTALHYAAKGHQRECARLLLEGGVDALAVNNAGQTASDLVARDAWKAKGRDDNDAWDKLLFDAEAEARQKSLSTVVGAHVKVTSVFHAPTEQHCSEVLELGLTGTIIKLEWKSAIVQFKGHETSHVVSFGKFRNLDAAVQKSSLALTLHIGEAAPNGLRAIECKNVGGDTLATLRVDSSKTVSDLRRRVQEELTHVCALDAGQSAELALPNGYVFPASSDESSLSVVLILAKAYAKAPEVVGGCSRPGCLRPAMDGMEGGWCSTICMDTAARAHAGLERPKFEKACLFKAVGIVHEDRPGTFQADSKLVGWRGDDGSIAAYPWTSVRRAEWLAGRLKIQVELEDGSTRVAGFEFFLDEDYEKFNVHFQSKGVGKIHVLEAA